MSAALRVVAVALGAALVGALGFAVPAGAHVTVDPTSAVQGGFARLAFRVPNESDTATTTKLQVHLPENAPVAALATMSVPGWTATVERANDRVSAVTWTAGSGAAIKPGEFQEFPVSLGPLPTVDALAFKALQTYSDGTIVRWIDEVGADGKEPEYPAPVLTLTRPAGAVPADPGDERDSLPVWLTIAALVAGVGGLTLGGLAFARTRAYRRNGPDIS